VAGSRGEHVARVAHTYGFMSTKRGESGREPQRRRGGLHTSSTSSTGVPPPTVQQPITVLERLEDGSPELYALLGVSEQCSETELKRAYRKRALELHPDRNRDDPQAEDRFHAAKEAYDRLRVLETRTEYDQLLVKLRARATHSASRRADLCSLEEREQAHAQATRERTQDRQQYQHQVGHRGAVGVFWK
jgi:DnaJ domain